ncbi:hypothetical protein [Flavobacterium sp. '19STA2R22 D10 B1']|uniref:hypothetical protein n=1 Tax=Flavobacterium aerium TaxID=3037261 RepID=UPI00278BC09F|nr:hypothetical protein [Flavobacterium sp. '19STA2R22 D10 B1']
MKIEMSKMLVSCKIATELIEKKGVVKLSRNESVQLKFHTLICNVCRRYEKQSAIIDKALEQMHRNNNLKLELPSAIKAQIISAIEKK